MQTPFLVGQRIIPTLRPSVLRLAVVSALGVYAATLAQGAHATCQNHTDAKGLYSVCQGANGTDGSSSQKQGKDGEAVNFTSTNNLTVNVADWLADSPPGNVPGVVMGSSRGGKGVDEATGGKGGSVQITNQANLVLEGTTHSGYFQSLISATSTGGAGDDDNDNNNSSGGAGGAGQNVTVSNSGSLTIRGSVQPYSNSGGTSRNLPLYGITAISSGATGGNQNSSVLGNQLGGPGGMGGDVMVTNSGSISLGDTQSRLTGFAQGAGIQAISNGGRGGENNGSAGNASRVVVDNTGNIRVAWNAQDGDEVYGIHALSFAGDGTESHDNSDPGGAGGNGGPITVTSSGQILVDIAGTFRGEGAGIAGRSQAGNGGKGPSNNKTGGQGGSAFPVYVQLSGTGSSITTRGASVYGILAQSVGGQGGDGGDAAAIAGQGGGAGFGGNASSVTVKLDPGSSIQTAGDFSAGILGQSIGGGGGTGGTFVSVLAGQGGNGGSGGDASTVNIDSAGNITTAGAHAHGVLAQSIAGSGGAGGVDVSGVIALGGDGAGGGAAGAVAVNQSGIVSTQGYGSHGVTAQSIGGGGGASGSAIGALSIGGSAEGTTPSQGGSVQVRNAGGQIHTTGNAAAGIVAQSIGGGGGSGGDSLGILGVGGDGAAGGQGGHVSIQDIGTITTAGRFSPGVLAQSIGGGGGNGGDTFTASIGVAMAIGGSGSGGGNGGSVCLGNAGACGDMSPGPMFLTTHGDYSPGIIAQNIGGGGGTGGSATNATLQSLVALQLGGSGGNGGYAGRDGTDINYTNLNIRTGGSHSAAILAQSIGGGGGNGGDASHYDASIGFSSALVVGGSGGAGGTGAKTSVTLRRSQIATGMDYKTANPDTYAPNDSFGILAQSIGGGGGNGGSASATNFILAAPIPDGTPVSLSFQASIGGQGGNGGHACASGDASCVTQITLLEDSSITTLGDGSHAAVAQSIGGGGGNGGDASVLSTGISYADSLTGKIGLSLGGRGGSASHGGKAVVTLGTDSTEYVNLPASIQLPIDLNNEAAVLAPASTIRTYGDFSNGVLAQSIGGGGGNGGVGSSDSYSAGGMVEVDLNIGLGGSGGGGGDGGEVDLYLGPTYTVHTLGSGSRGLVAQSIGGGGGTSQGGTMSLGASVEGIGGKLSLGIGQAGGTGGHGGFLKAQIDGAIRTQGGDADGVLLQSIGGGGGLAGSIGADSSSHPILDRVGQVQDLVDKVSDAESQGYGFEVDIGGKGGTGGNGGQIDIDFGGKIATAGDWADGIVAQSIGGGGGAGGSSTAAGSEKSAQINVAIGGTGGTGGSGGSIIAFFDGNHNNYIGTSGYSAYGVLLQSIGGGGGHGGDGSDMASGEISVGGGAGGGGGVSGRGGNISTNGTGSWLSVHTEGSDSPAFAAQSVGGGGGIGGAGNSDSDSRLDASHQVALSVGGRGGTGNHGGNISIQLGTSASTQGDRAYGFLLQSIGGGGGVAGAGKAANLTSVGLGGRGGAGGDGGAVTLTLNSGSKISTAGAGSHGVLAQSIGGGGGVAGDSSVNLGLSPQGWTIGGGETGGVGTGGTVTVNSNANISTTGVNAFGIVAQSIGGGGGLAGNSSGGFAGTTGRDSGSGRGGRVAVNHSGNIRAAGAGATGIFAQSTGPDGGGNVYVDLYGSVQGGSGNAASVWVADGFQNAVNIRQDGVVVASDNGVGVRYNGSGTTAQGSTLDINLSGNAVMGGNIECQNASGSGSGTDKPCNAYAGNQTVMKEATLYQANIHNGGLLEIGRTGRFETLTIEGDFEQLASGVLRADMDFGGLRTDHLLVKGDAKLGGGFDLAAISLLPRRELRVLDVEGNLSGHLEAIDSPIFDFHLRRAGNTHHAFVRGANFNAASQGLERNHAGVADHLQFIWDSGGTLELGPLFAALNNASKSGPSEYRERLTDLAPGSALAPAGQMSAGMSNFMGTMMSCPLSDGTAVMRERNCFWGQVTRRHTDHDGGDGSPGYSFDSTVYQFGGQREVKPGWFLGASASYQDSRLRGNSGRVSGNGDVGYLGVVLKRESGPWLLSGTLAGGYGSHRMHRNLSIAGYDNRVSGSPDVYSVGARFRAARQFALSETLYLKPYVDLDAFYTRMKGYTESGGPLALQVEGSDQFVMSVSPMLEFGGQVRTSDGTIFRPFAYAGAAFLSKETWTSTARLAAAPAGGPSITTSLPGDRVVGRFGIGLTVNSPSGLDFRLQYDGEASSKVRSHAGQLKLMYRY